MNKSDSTHLHNAFVWVGERSAGFTAIINPPLFKLY